MRFATLTTEERTEMLAKAREARKANTLARRQSGLRQDFLDANYWEELARKHKLRLPAWGIPLTISRMRTIIHRAGMSQIDCEEHLGKLSILVAGNPDWPTRAFAGLVLEMKEEIEHV